MTVSEKGRRIQKISNTCLDTEDDFTIYCNGWVLSAAQLCLIAALTEVGSFMSLTYQPAMSLT
jgi:hypothetical protein